jgi:hypothetical protein
MAARATAKSPSSLLVKSNPDTRPIARWQIQIDADDDIGWHDFLAVINTDADITRWCDLGMTLDLRREDTTAQLTTTDPAVAAALVREHGAMWHRSETDDEPSADALFAEGAYKLHLIFVAVFTKNLSERLITIVKRYGFRFKEELAGPLPLMISRRPARIQLWFVSDRRPNAQDEIALRAELDRVTANICEISEIDPNDFCNLSLYPGHPEYDPENRIYMGRGLGCGFGGDDDPGGGEEGDGEPLVDPNSRRAA